MGAKPSWDEGMPCSNGLGVVSLDLEALILIFDRSSMAKVNANKYFRMGSSIKQTAS